jgi:hypothetical protein
MRYTLGIMKTKLTDQQVGTHVTHCCEYHGCKYGNENCPVENKEVDQQYPCMECETLTELEEQVQEINEQITLLKKIAANKKTHGWD